MFAFQVPINFGDDFEVDVQTGKESSRFFVRDYQCDIHETPVTSAGDLVEPDDSDFAGGTIKKGLMWLQRDRIFSRWKERFFVLTKDHLQCFKKGSSRISEMGGFVFKIRLTEVIKR